MRKKKIVKSNIYKDLILDSQDEVDMCYWFDELKSKGYIKSWSRSPSFVITEGLYHSYTEVLVMKTKTRTKECTQILLRPSEYTPDFVVVWNKKAEGIFFEQSNVGKKITLPFIAYPGLPCYIESKPSRTFDPNNMLRLFRINQKFMWKLHNIFVNLVVPEELFPSTFTPKDVKIPTVRKTKKEKWIRRDLQ